MIKEAKGSGVLISCRSLKNDSRPLFLSPEMVPGTFICRPREQIEQTILLIRGHNVMLDGDLAQLYGVTVGRLNEAVKRNEDRFPSDFTFQLTKAEFENLKSQIAISSSKWGGRRHAPDVFTNRAGPCYPACCEASAPLR